MKTWPPRCASAARPRLPSGPRRVAPRRLDAAPPGGVRRQAGRDGCGPGRLPRALDGARKRLSPAPARGRGRVRGGLGRGARKATPRRGLELCEVHRARRRLPQPDGLAGGRDGARPVPRKSLARRRKCQPRTSCPERGIGARGRRAGAKATPPEHVACVRRQCGLRRRTSRFAGPARARRAPRGPAPRRGSRRRGSPFAAGGRSGRGPGLAIGRG